MTQKFVITGLPRTRGAWLAAYFSQGDVLCYHEATLNFSDMDVEGYTHVGNSDSGYTICPDWVEELGDHKLVVVHRNPLVVTESLKKVGFGDLTEQMVRQADVLRKLEGLHIEFEEINPRLKEIQEYLEVPGYDESRATLFFNMRIQSLDWSK